MPKQFKKQINWTEEQNQVLQSNPDLIINGCAGTGKTLLACHIALKYSIEKKVAILVFTKSLRTFIKEYLNSYDNNTISVLYKYQWKNKDYDEFDIIIVDEYQDFSISDIKAVIDKANFGVYLFGDIEQRIYVKNFQKEETVKKEELINTTKYKSIELTENFRISEENQRFISSVYSTHSLKQSNFLSGLKPIVNHFEKMEAEVNWLKNFIINSEFKNIGILLKENDSFRGGYYYKRRVFKEMIWGILDLHSFLTNEGMSIGYKYFNQDNLDFSKEKNVNILTIHSAKGLEFDCVILPFSNYVNDFSKTKNLQYVGLTRASNHIIITYSGCAEEKYYARIPDSYFNGTIRKKSNYDNPTPQDYMQSIQLQAYKDLPGNEHLKKIYEEQWDETGCKIFKS